MIVSHWGIFPGWLRPKRTRGGYPINPRPEDLEFEPVDWETFLAAVEMIEAAERDRAAEVARWLRHAGRLH